MISIIALDVAFQASAILNQTRIFAVPQAARSRLNTAYAVSNFIVRLGLCSRDRPLDRNGWPAITTAGILLSCAALAIRTVVRRAPQPTTAPTRPPSPAQPTTTCAR